LAAQRGYHGVNFGAYRLVRIVSNRKDVRYVATGVDHLPHNPMDIENNAGLPRGIFQIMAPDLADELERYLHLTTTLHRCKP